MSICVACVESQRYVRPYFHWMRLLLFRKSLRADETRSALIINIPKRFVTTLSSAQLPYTSEIMIRDLEISSSFYTMFFIPSSSPGSPGGQTKSRRQRWGLWERVNDSRGRWPLPNSNLIQERTVQDRVLRYGKGGGSIHLKPCNKYTTFWFVEFPLVRGTIYTFDVSLMKHG
jgi:hypothetical protein